MFTVMITPLKHNETPFLKLKFFFSIIIPAMGHYRLVYYSICDRSSSILFIPNKMYYVIKVPKGIFFM